MQTLRSPHELRVLRNVLAVVAIGFLLSSCAEDERRELRLTPTSTVETGVRILADNCPGPSTVSLSVREDVLWEVEAPVVGDSADSSTITTSALPESKPGLVEFLVGNTPDGWNNTIELVEPLSPGIRYTIRTTPDGQSINFSTPDLSAGLLWDGTGNAQFNPDLIQVECSEPADVEGFARDLLLLIGLWVTAAATVMVALILVLFVVTRRFSRIRSLQKRAERDAQLDDERPRTRSSS